MTECKHCERRDGLHEPGCEPAERAAVVAEALSWLTAAPGGRPTGFLHGQCVKGVAADCARYPTAVYEASGIPVLPVPNMPQQWFMHTRDRQLYLDQVKRMFAEFRLAGYDWMPAAPDEAAPIIEKAMPEPGDFLVARSRYIYSHGAIVIAWPEVISCYPPGVTRQNAKTNPIFRAHMRFFDPWGKRD